MAEGNVSLLGQGGVGGAAPLFSGNRTAPMAGAPALGQNLPGGSGLDQGTTQLLQYVQLLKAVNEAKKSQADAGGGGGGGGLLSGMMGGKGGAGSGTGAAGATGALGGADIVAA